MPGYIKTALHKFQHPLPRRAQYAPHQWKPPKYGQRVQFVKNNNRSPQLSKTAKTRIPQIVGTLLYYSIALDFTMLPALGNLASQQANPTKRTMSDITWLLDYCATLLEAKLKYIKSDMILWTASDASYLSEPKAPSRAGGWFFLSDKRDNLHQNPTTEPTPNGPIHVLAKIITPVMRSAMEAEVGATFMTAHEACPIRVTLKELGHPQLPTPMQVDNSTAVGFAKDQIKHKCSKAINMRFHWICDRVNQKQFAIY